MTSEESIHFAVNDAVSCCSMVVSISSIEVVNSVGRSLGLQAPSRYYPVDHFDFASQSSS